MFFFFHDFIYDPLQTNFVYNIYLKPSVCCASTIDRCLGVSSFCFLMTKFFSKSSSYDYEFDAISSFNQNTFWQSFQTVLVMVQLTFVCIHIFTFGSFNNFLTLQNLALPLTITLVAFIFVKPTKKYFISTFSGGRVAIFC